MNLSCVPNKGRAELFHQTRLIKEACSTEHLAERLTWVKPDVKLRILMFLITTRINLHIVPESGCFCSVNVLQKREKSGELFCIKRFHDLRMIWDVKYTANFDRPTNRHVSYLDLLAIITLEVNNCGNIFTRKVTVDIIV